MILVARKPVQSRERSVAIEVIADQHTVGNSKFTPQRFQHRVDVRTLVVNWNNDVEFHLGRVEAVVTERSTWLEFCISSRINCARKPSAKLGIISTPFRIESRKREASLPTGAIRPSTPGCS